MPYSLIEYGISLLGHVTKYYGLGRFLQITTRQLRKTGV